MSDESEFMFKIDIWQQKLEEERARTLKWKEGYQKAMDLVNELFEQKNSVLKANMTLEEQISELRFKIDEIEHKVTNAFDQMDV